MEKPVLQPGEWCSFGNEREAIKLGGSMISDQDVAGLSIDSFVSVGMGLILQGLAGEGKIDGETLPRNSGRTSG
jgi:hypothetical protein